jgi:tetratricopeptide (TPR) repeat protein
VVNLLYRHDTLSASDAHSVPLQWLAETGMIGGALAIGAWVQLLRGGVRALRGAGAERWAAAALLASALAYTVHACYDWDWEIPGVTLPVLVILGVLGAAVTLPAGKPATETYRPVAATGRTALLAIGSCLLCVFAVSAILPGIAASRASGSLIEASAGRLVAAQHDANLATRLDPLSDAGPLASEAIALQLKSLRLARSDLIEALRREPDDWRAWLTLGSVDGSLGRWPEVLSAAQRAIALNPEMDDTQLVQVAIAARAANVNQAPPEGSATAQP